MDLDAGVRIEAVAVSCGPLTGRADDVMDPFGFLFLLVALVLGVLAFRAAMTIGLGWGVALFFGVIPIAATFFLGIIGLLASAVMVGGLYKASA